MYIIAGCNGAGKTTACYTLLPELLECREFVNSDEFSKALSPFTPSAAAIPASRYMLQKIYYLLERNMDFCVETTLATRSLVGIIHKAKERGYKIVLLYFWLISPEFAISRVKARVEAGGHNISDEAPLFYGPGLFLPHIYADLRQMGACRQYQKPICGRSRRQRQTDLHQGQRKVQSHLESCSQRWRIVITGYSESAPKNSTR